MPRIAIIRKPGWGATQKEERIPNDPVKARELGAKLWGRQCS